MKQILFLGFYMLTACAIAQFAPAAGYEGTTAISKDDSRFAAWATGCTIQRGYMDIAVPDSGFASVGAENSAIGAAGQNGVVSLGDSGIATLTFAQTIYNGPGADFAVFENGFYTGIPMAFLEFAFVEVSSDGENFFRFPVTTHIQDTAQMAMEGSDCSLVNNLAGKYVFGYGTPFDLEELKNEQGLDVNAVTHVRVIDVVGSVTAHATHDQYGTKINDPYPTPFASSGFDLDAVGVLHATGISTSVSDVTAGSAVFAVYPNPSSGNVFVRVSTSLIGEPVIVYDVTGKILLQQSVLSNNIQLTTDNFSKGLYFISIANHTTKLIIE